MLLIRVFLGLSLLIHTHAFPVVSKSRRAKRAPVQVALATTETAATTFHPLRAFFPSASDLIELTASVQHGVATPGTPITMAQLSNANQPNATQRFAFDAGGRLRLNQNTSICLASPQATFDQRVVLAACDDHRAIEWAVDGLTFRPVKNALLCLEYSLQANVYHVGMSPCRGGMRQQWIFSDTTQGISLNIEESVMDHQLAARGQSEPKDEHSITFMPLRVGERSSVIEAIAEQSLLLPGSPIVLSHFTSAIPQGLYQLFGLDSHYRIRLNLNQSLCLGTEVVTSGQPINVVECGSVHAIKWTVAGTLFHPNGEDNLCLDNYHLLKEDGNEIGLWTCNGGWNQDWSLSFPEAIPSEFQASGLPYETDLVIEVTEVTEVVASESESRSWRRSSVTFSTATQITHAMSTIVTQPVVGTAIIPENYQPQPSISTMQPSEIPISKYIAASTSSLASQHLSYTLLRVGGASRNLIAVPEHGELTSGNRIVLAHAASERLIYMHAEFALEADGHVRIRRADLCLTAVNASFEQPVILGVCENAIRWTADAGRLHPNGNLSLCLDNYHLLENDGNEIGIWTCNGGWNQNWSLGEGFISSTTILSSESPRQASSKPGSPTIVPHTSLSVQTSDIHPFISEEGDIPSPSTSVSFSSFSKNSIATVSPFIAPHTSLSVQPSDIHPFITEGEDIPSPSTSVSLSSHSKKTNSITTAVTFNSEAATISPGPSNARPLPTAAISTLYPTELPISKYVKPSAFTAILPSTAPRIVTTKDVVDAINGSPVSYPPSPHSNSDSTHPVYYLSTRVRKLHSTLLVFPPKSVNETLIYTPLRVGGPSRNLTASTSVGNITSGSPVVLANASTSSETDQFALDQQGLIRIQSVPSLCVTAAAPSFNNRVFLGPCDDAITWTVDGTQVHPGSNTLLCLDNYHLREDAGNEIGIWTCNGGWNQEWSLGRGSESPTAENELVTETAEGSVRTEESPPASYAPSETSPVRSILFSLAEPSTEVAERTMTAAVASVTANGAFTSADVVFDNAARTASRRTRAGHLSTSSIPRMTTSPTSSTSTSTCTVSEQTVVLYEPILSTSTSTTTSTCKEETIYLTEYV
ncbi:hypothetical protein BC830DRAFT_1083663 [Chytriomyces sp. MP71]|nr:hypothetical protein BC830DRAFT_1083663 [Chytriomyces sp. MP71]